MFADSRYSEMVGAVEGFGMSAGLSVQGVALLVRDLVAVSRFYRRVIGLAVLEEAGDRVVLGAGGVALLELLHRPGALASDPAAAGLFHVAFLLPGRVDLGRWLVHARGLGQGLDGAADHLVSEAVYLRDPEGNGIEVYADRPAADWVWHETPEGRRIGMANARLDMAGLLAAAAAPGVAAWDGAPAGTRVGHVHLQVGDAAAATGFYAGVLGLDVTAAGPAAVFLSSGGYHHHIAVNTWNSAGAGPREAGRAGLARVTLGQPGLAAVRPDAVDPWGTEFRFQTPG